MVEGANLFMSASDGSRLAADPAARVPRQVAHAVSPRVSKAITAIRTAMP
jgi:hypothetical protein